MYTYEEDKYEQIIKKYKGLGFIERCDIQNIRNISITGETNIQERVENSIKNFQRLLVDRLR